MKAWHRNSNLWAFTSRLSKPGYFRTNFLTGESIQAAVAVISDYEPTSGAPPLRFAAGCDAVQGVEDKLTAVQADIDKWRMLSKLMSHDT